MDTRETPDAELVAVQRLSPLMPGVHVTWDPPKGTAFDTMLASKPIVSVGRLPNSSTAYLDSWDSVYLDFDVYASSKAVVNATMKTLRAKVRSLHNTVHSGYTIGRVDESMSPTKRPEINPAVYRLGVTYNMWIRP